METGELKTFKAFLPGFWPAAERGRSSYSCIDDEQGGMIESTTLKTKAWSEGFVSVTRGH